MTELERALVLLGRDLAVPATPELATAVRRRLARRRRWPLAAVLAAAAVAVAVAFAVPGSRAAILRFFHLRGAEVTIVERLPRLPATADLGVPIGLGAADFRLLLPDGREPAAVYAYQGGYWLRYPGLLLYEFRSGNAVFLKKVAGSAAEVEYVEVGGEPGIWVGTRHAVYLPGGNARTAGHVLLWQHGALTLRLEAAVTKERAIAIALRIR
jgi:hypothetical protein